MDIDEAKYLKITMKVMSDTSPLTVDIDIMSAWLLISGLQLTVKHPELNPRMKASLEDIARKFQSRIVAVHPDAEELIEMGWNEAYDVDEDGKFVNSPDVVTVGVSTCTHENKMVFVHPTGGADLACLDCDSYLAMWTGVGNAPDWLPSELRDLRDE